MIYIKQTLFPIACTSILGAAVWLATASSSRIDQAHPVSTNVRSHAIALAQYDDMSGNVDKTSLQNILIKVQPRWKLPKVNFLLHALRLWGVDAEFGIDPYNEYGTGTPSGQEMLNLLLDTRIAMAAGVDPSPFIHRNTYGVEAQYEVAGCGIAHHDQYLKVMGELGLPSNTPVILEDGSASSLKELVTTSLYKFRIEQELEFTAVAYSRWLPPARTWTSESNIVHSFDELAVNLLKRNPADTACDGIHGLYALVNILRANELHNILSPEVEGEVTNHLREISRTLENIQDANGLWTSGWYLKTKADSKSPYEFQAISATGHHLEWIALAPSSVRPNRFVIKKAARALCLLLEQQPLKNVSNTYPPFSHAARALCLLENLQPGQLLKTK